MRLSDPVPIGRAKLAASVLGAWIAALAAAQDQSTPPDPRWAGTRVTIPAGRTLSEALAQLAERTGATVEGGQALEQVVADELRDVEFWPALDRLLTAARVHLAAMDAPAGCLKLELDDGGKLPPIAYAGAFRGSALRCQAAAVRGDPNNVCRFLVVELRWEPRLHVASLTLPAGAVKVAYAGEAASGAGPDSTLAAAIPWQTSRVEFPIPLPLPAPDAEGRAAEARVHVAFDCVALADFADFQFADLHDPGREIVRRQGETTVAVQGWTTRGERHSIRVLLQLDRDEGTLESYRDWAARLACTLDDEMETTYRPVDVEVVRQSGREVVLRYTFLQDPDAMRLVLHAPTSVIHAPVTFDFAEIDLP